MENRIIYRVPMASRYRSHCYPTVFYKKNPEKKREYFAIIMSNFIIKKQSDIYNQNLIGYVNTKGKVTWESMSLEEFHQNYEIVDNNFYYTKAYNKFLKQRQMRRQIKFDPYYIGSYSKSPKNKKEYFTPNYPSIVYDLFKSCGFDDEQMEWVEIEMEESEFLTKTKKIFKYLFEILKNK